MNSFLRVTAFILVILFIGFGIRFAADYFFPTPDMFLSQAQVAEYTTVKPNRYLFRTDGRERRRPQPRTRIRSQKKKK